MKVHAYVSKCFPTFVWLTDTSARTKVIERVVFGILPVWCTARASPSYRNSHYNETYNILAYTYHCDVLHSVAVCHNIFFFGQLFYFSPSVINELQIIRYYVGARRLYTKYAFITCASKITLAQHDEVIRFNTSTVM